MAPCYPVIKLPNLGSNAQSTVSGLCFRDYPKKKFPTGHFGTSGNFFFGGFKSGKSFHIAFSVAHHDASWVSNASNWRDWPCSWHFYDVWCFNKRIANKIEAIHLRNFAPFPHMNLQYSFLETFELLKLQKDKVSSCIRQTPTPSGSWKSSSQ